MRESLPLAAALAHLFCASALTGLIWMVQVVTYPQFLDVGREAFTAFHDRYLGLVARVVMPLMLTELFLCAVVVFLSRGSASLPWAIAGAVLLAGIWLSTALLQVPLHRQLSAGFDADAVRSLVATNGIRTILWTVRSAIAALLVWRLAQPGDGHG